MAKLELLPLWLSIVLSLPILSAAQTTRGINVLFVNDESNSVAEKALDVALNYVRRTASTGIQFDSFLRVSSNTTDAKTLLEALCDKYDNSLKTEKGPDLVLDFTQTGVSSETVKSFTHALALPTVSASYGQDDDLRQWHFLSDDQLKYLVQVSPPADMIPEVIRSIVLSWNISNAGILFDDSFVMDHKYKSLLQNVPTRHLIAAVEEPRSLKRQLNRLRDLDIVNFFVLGRLNTLKNVLDAANANKFFGRKFAWFAITQEKGQLKCSATNATILFLKPEPDPTARERLEKLRTDFSLTVEPEIASAFYFDLSLRAFMAVKQMMDKNQWPRLEYTSCEEYEEENPVVRKGYDLRRALREVQEPPSYASINVEDRNGHSFMEASMRLEKVTVMNGQSVSAEVEGSWKLGLDSPLMIKDVASISNLTAASVYRIVTVIVRKEIWKDMSLNDSLSEVERAKLAVWDYPVGDKYTKMWQAMLDAKMPEDLDAAVKRVRSSVSSSDGFAYLGDATDIRWLSQTSCDLQMVGEEFSRKPYAIAVQQGSPLKDQFNNAILQLLNKRKLEKLKERWWSLNPEIKKCDKQDDQQDGISIQNIGGVFIVIFVGIGLACVTLAFEYYWYKYKRNPRVTDLAGGPLPNAPRVGKGGGLGGQQQGRLAVIGRPDEQAAKLDAATLGQVLGQGYNYRRNGNQLPGVNQAWQH
ncbi:Ionotropic receptor 25a [Frankliniella occidentalis]|uniref:Ionotropic receptor 25a n=1 Tax=Frankliniella occidentalis TaxID=133901 RepID=A0A9C6UFJ2_FRAOC|nr:ionotropic receptor 25a [Frankliniella occidentalis]KAE8742923.1 Ionotropic receptor 25a [Frankliniella occidentalis]